MGSFLSDIVSNTAFAGALTLLAFGVQRIGRSPQLAHALWLLVLIKLVTPPVFHVALPVRFGLSVSRVADRGSPENMDGLRTSVVAERMLPPRTSPPKPARRDGKPIPAADESTGGPAEMTAETMFPAPPGASADSSLATVRAGRWQVLLCAVWAGGVIVGLAILSRRLGQFHTLLIEAVDGDVTLIDDVRALARRLGMRNCPSIRILDAHVPPLVFAAWRSLILLIPARLLRGLDREQLHAVLVHELAHIRRRDHLTRWFEIFVRGIFWWHPLAWWASRQLRQAEEECCDAWVVWALPNSRRSYGEALLWTIEFLAERRLFSAVAGTALGGSHVKRRIEMIMNQQLNRRMSWSALIAVIVVSASVLPVAAQIGNNPVQGTIQERGNDSGPKPSKEFADGHSQAVAEKRDVEARIEQLERLVQELSKTIKRQAADSNKLEQIKRDVLTDPRPKDAKWVPFDAHWNAGRQLLFAMRPPEAEEDRQLKEILIALDKQLWDAAGKGDWAVYEKLQDDDYFGFYVNSAGLAREDKATVVAAVKRRRYFDAHIRDQVAKRIGKGTAILTYIYSCKVEEAGHLQTYRDHQATQVWTQRDGSWVFCFSQDFILPGGE
jgi:beta-lactamase regulating signal transducer with metallopeptidase domain